MEVTPNDYEGWNVITSNGAKFTLRERDGALDIRSEHGGLVVQPRSSNVIEVRTVDLFPKVAKS